MTLVHQLTWANAYVKADFDDKASLVRAMQGAYAVFALTNYWEKLDMQLEIDQGKKLADAAKEAGVQHYIWSSLLNISKRECLPARSRVVSLSTYVRTYLPT